MAELGADSFTRFPFLYFIDIYISLRIRVTITTEIRFTEQRKKN